MRSFVPGRQRATTLPWPPRYSQPRATPTRNVRNRQRRARARAADALSDPVDEALIQTARRPWERRSESSRHRPHTRPVGSHASGSCAGGRACGGGRGSIDRTRSGSRTADDRRTRRGCARRRTGHGLPPRRGAGRPREPTAAGLGVQPVAQRVASPDRRRLGCRPLRASGARRRPTAPNGRPRLQPPLPHVGRGDRSASGEAVSGPCRR
jgi:hypothetical protein